MIRQNFLLLNQMLSASMKIKMVRTMRRKKILYLQMLGRRRNLNIVMALVNKRQPLRSNNFRSTIQKIVREWRETKIIKVEIIM